MTRGNGIPMPKVSWRFFTSPGLIPEAATRMRTSPAPGSGFALSPPARDARRGALPFVPSRFHDAPDAPPEEVGRTRDEFDRPIIPQTVAALQSTQSGW